MVSPIFLTGICPTDVQRTSLYTTCGWRWSNCGYDFTGSCIELQFLTPILEFGWVHVYTLLAVFLPLTVWLYFLVSFFWAISWPVWGISNARNLELVVQNGNIGSWTLASTAGKLLALLWLIIATCGHYLPSNFMDSIGTKSDFSVTNRSFYAS